MSTSTKAVNMTTNLELRAMPNGDVSIWLLEKDDNNIATDIFVGTYIQEPGGRDFIDLEPCVVTVEEIETIIQLLLEHVDN